MDATRTSLIHRIRDPQDKEAWARFVVFYEPMLKAYVRSLNVPAHDTDDVVQNVLVSVWRAMPTFELDHSKGRFRTFLYRLTINAVRDRWRRIAVRSGVVVPWSPDLPEPGTTDPEPGEAWDKAVQKRRMELALREVQTNTDPNTWACFQEHKLEGRDSNEVAAELELTPEAVRTNASRVFKRVTERARELAGEIDP
jgi:RNA polymerase sigma-70 factor (ECF subfamily)